MLKTLVPHLNFAFPPIDLPTYLRSHLPGDTYLLRCQKRRRELLLLVLNWLCLFKNDYHTVASTNKFLIQSNRVITRTNNHANKGQNIHQWLLKRGLALLLYFRSASNLSARRDALNHSPKQQLFVKPSESLGRPNLTVRPWKELGQWTSRKR